MDHSTPASSAEAISSHGHNAFVAAFYEGDLHAFDKICATLAL